MDGQMINIGFGNTVVSTRVVAVILPNSAPSKRLREEALKNQRLIDATHGRKTRSIIITDSNHLFLSSVNPETLVLRLSNQNSGARPGLALREV
jgi:regulator of extracellular matrix RemA (YlzA/DUF370 family)